MLSIYPKVKETRLVTLSEGQFYDNLEKFIKPINPKNQTIERSDFLFNGTWDKEGFVISLILKISNNFVPIIKGEMISSVEGILVKLTYEMFPATKKLLLIWTIITILITLFFVVLYQEWLYGSISFGFCLVNYVLSNENFKIQTRKSRRMIEKLFSYTEE